MVGSSRLPFRRCGRLRQECPNMSKQLNCMEFCWVARNEESPSRHVPTTKPPGPKKRTSTPPKPTIKIIQRVTKPKPPQKPSTTGPPSKISPNAQLPQTDSGDRSPRTKAVQSRRQSATHRHPRRIAPSGTLEPWGSSGTLSSTPRGTISFLLRPCY